MSLSLKLVVGRSAEQTALRYLKSHGLTLVTTNYRCRWGEIDLICTDRDLLVFVEVRYRSTTTMLRPEETVEFRKQQRLGKTALHYLQHNRESAHRGCRFDVVAISGNLKDPKIDWYRDAFQYAG